LLSKKHPLARDTNESFWGILKGDFFKNPLLSRVSGMKFLTISHSLTPLCAVLLASADRQTLFLCLKKAQRKSCKKKRR